MGEGGLMGCGFVSVAMVLGVGTTQISEDRDPILGSVSQTAIEVLQGC